MREAVFQTVVREGWTLLEMRPESMVLEDVFVRLTAGEAG